ncbi:MAG: AMP-binding protein [Lunatimonas sp.]|uniref:AMP-binding protein n=1 Tax=Lunatimonas sp. TaxID=2060141 RepID=UPI00263A6C30|nr:AMP-binding protein [Lunatimonas sp.]MCC5938541.1 AMP-binding protein [Lunatimonas sp.]
MIVIFTRKILAFREFFANFDDGFAQPVIQTYPYAHLKIHNPRTPLNSHRRAYRELVITSSEILTFDQLKRGDWRAKDQTWEAALRFCQQWLHGEEYFTLKTSGSTGAPKEIQVHRELMRKSAAATKKYLGLRIGCTLLCNLNTDMIAGKMMLVRAMEWKGCLFLRTPSSVISCPIREIDIDFGAVVPMQLQASMEDPDGLKTLNRIANLLVGGAPTPPSLRQKLKSLKGRVFQTFGMTETVSHIAMADLKASGPLLYKALPGVKFSQSESGKLVIKAPMAIAQTVYTNDVVELMDSTTFEWKGRADFVVNSGGVKLYPELIEEEMEPYWRKYFPHNRFFIWKTSDKLLGEALLLVTERVTTDNPDMNDFLITIGLHLPKYHIPKRILSVDTFKMTASSKINKLETLKPFHK